MTIDRQQMNRLPNHVARHIRPEPNGCWIWTGAISRYGYGRSWLNHEDYQAHRLVYWHLVGPLPRILHHTCENRRCVNPKHLLAVNARSHFDFHRHQPHGQRDRMRARTHCANGHEFTEANTQWRTDGGRRCRTCSAAHERAYRKRGKRRAAA